MDSIRRVLQVLSAGAARVTENTADSQVRDAYSRASVLVKGGLRKGRAKPHVRQAYELCVTRADDPMTWLDPIFEIALRDIPRTHMDQIYGATKVLAMRLPGKPGVDSDEDEQEGDESEALAGEE
jgi:hypothetical protein